MEALLDQPVTALPGASKKAAQLLDTAFRVRTVRDLLDHVPHEDKYREASSLVLVDQGLIGQPVTIVGTIHRWQVVRPKGRGRLTIAKATVIDDAHGRVEVPFFNQEWLAGRHPEGTRVAVSGILEAFKNQRQLKNAKLTLLDPLAAAEDVAGERDPVEVVYPATEGLASARIASLVTAALQAVGPLPDPLPEELRAARALETRDWAVRTIHRPQHLGDVAPARRRLVYDELLTLQLGLQQRRHRLEAEAVGLEQAPQPGGLVERFVASLPFAPTADQLRAFAELDADLARGKPMHRLLQGDVGTGKTLVAARAMLAVVEHGRQAVLMVPTAVLAEQHQRTLTRLLAPLGVNAAGGPRMELLTGASTATHAKRVLLDLMGGSVDLLIGTHAVLEERVQPVDLGLVVIDEQHRFGVEHRTRLRDKRRDGRSPDILVMTATPIPRSLALTVYGDLDVTVLRERPGADTFAMRTLVLPTASPRRAKLYDFVRDEVAAGHRCYVVCPLVEGSDALEDVADVETVHARLTKEFPGTRIGLVHGRLPAAQREAVMEEFRSGAAPILVTTTVVEVGVDVGEATVMLIEDADRFGISQLHQLRGRLYRGLGAGDGITNFCVLFTSDPEANSRLEAVAASHDGFELAEADLRLRGEGSLFDVRQSGLGDLRIARLARDAELIAQTRTDARALVESDPALDAHPLLRDEVTRRFGADRLAALTTG